MLFARRVRGEAVEPAVIEAAGGHVLRVIVKKQIGTGLDAIDDGEIRAGSAHRRHRLNGCRQRLVLMIGGGEQVPGREG